MNDRPILGRLLEAELAKAARSFPVAVVSGARQTGKSTLVQTMRGAASRSYVTLDDLEMLARARDEPDALVSSSRRLTLDEVQRSPEILLAVKRAVDERREPGRFVLTGSANLLLAGRVSETLAGRAIYYSLWPLTRREQLGLRRPGVWSELLKQKASRWPEVLAEDSAPSEEWQALARRGGYPVPAYELSDDADRARWFAGYTQTYLERDLSGLGSISSLVDFRRLMRAAALRIGNLVNQTELARDVGSSQPTVHRHLNLLEASYQVVRVPPYSVNRTKRLIKTPKLYWSDTGLAMHLAGEARPRGAHLENIVLCDLMAWSQALPDRPSVMYWRTTAGDEVDFVIESGELLLPIEVKATSRPRLADARSLMLFRDEYPEHTRAGLLLHAGREISWLAEGILAAPWWRVI